MDYKERIVAIKEFLITHQYLHELEVLERYPDKFLNPYHEWVLDLEKLDLSDLLKIERDFATEKLTNSDLIQFVKTAHELSEIPSLPLPNAPLSALIERKLTPKKKHEIAKLVSLVDQKTEIKNIIDFGSGMGHLSMALTYKYPRKSTCVDMDADLQVKGQEKIERWLPVLKDKIQFTQAKVLTVSDFPEAIKHHGTMLIGLHACGPLSSLIVQSGAHHLINIGCCYHKLDRQYNLSTLCQNDPLWFSNHALTMAAKSLGTQNENDLKLKWQVKRYRYALEFLMHQMNLPAQSLGNAKSEDYQNDFASYVKKYAPLLKNQTDQFLNNYFANEKTQERLQYFFKAGTLRALLGRLIEIYIVLDRALYLQDQKKDVHVYQVFDSALSPRNLAIVF